MLHVEEIRIEGFKSLDPVQLPLDDGATFLVGSNGVGKSSILQAISFARAFGEGRCESYFETRGWQPKDIYPKTQRLGGNDADSSKRRSLPRPVRISIGFRHVKFKMFWEFAWSTTSERATGEYLYVKPDGGPVELVFAFGGNLRDEDTEPLPFKELKIDGSLTSMIRAGSLSRNDNQLRALEQLEKWYKGITSLELLSPIAMRRGARGQQEDIGPRGEYLASFLASISAAKRNRIVERVRRFYPLEQLNTTRKRAGWVDMQVFEQFRNFQRINPSHMSDGFFRLLGMCAIPEFEHHSSIILLDEVEDGIEPHILPKLIKQIDAETEAQLIMTSHSPLLVNNFSHEQIIFIARDRTGRSHAAQPNELANFREGLEYFGSGEIWANSDRTTFYDEVRQARNPRATLRTQAVAADRRARKYLRA
jgi:predicted ATPase